MRDMTAHRQEAASADENDVPENITDFFNDFRTRAGGVAAKTGLFHKIRRSDKPTPWGKASDARGGLSRRQIFRINILMVAPTPDEARLISSSSAGST